MIRATPVPRVIAIVGPTAAGKTAIAELFAEQFGGEIVSADSMQVYRGMDVGTAKPPVAERRVPHHCIDLVDPGVPYSAALYQRDARAAIDAIAARERTPVVCGGTGLYVRAALDDWAFPPGAIGEPERARLDALAATADAADLHARLAEVDPASAQLIHPNNTRRVIRALEMAACGESYAAQAAGFARRNSIYPTVMIGITRERARLYAAIDARVDEMLATGLLAEVEALLARGYREALSAAQAIGYKELVGVIEGTADLSEAVEAIKQATRRYAKRQLTWFRADPRIVWLDVTELSAEAAAEHAVGLVESADTE